MTQPQPNAAGMTAALYGLLAEDEDVDTTLSRVARVARRVIMGCDDVGVTRLLPTGWATTTVSTSDRVEHLDGARYRPDNGPPVSAFRDRDIGGRRSTGPPWRGTRSSLSIPIVVGDQGLQAVNLYRDREYQQSSAPRLPSAPSHRSIRSDQ